MKKISVRDLHLRTSEFVREAAECSVIVSSGAVNR
jgi:hypothetical protein